MGVDAKLNEIQYKLVAPKGQFNSFGKYRYRNCEDILEAVKPLLHEFKCTLTLSDEVVAIGEPVITTSHKSKEEYDASPNRFPTKHEHEETQICNQRFYIKATAVLTDLETGEQVTTTAYAREEDEKKGMDGSQITGASSSYARKYCLCGMLCIDDNKDSDTTNTHGKEEPKPDKAKKDVAQTKPIAFEIFTEYEQKKQVFEQYVIKGLIKKESWDNLLKAEADAKTDAAYQYLISKMTQNLKEAQELEKGIV